MIKIFESIPLIIFLGYLRIIDTQIPENWKILFVVTGCAATFIIAFSVYKKIVMDRVLLGFNIYFITGGVAFITHQWWLNNLYDQLHASGLLLWVIITGLITAFISSYGFIGVKSFDAKTIREYSYYLLFISIVAFSISFLFRGNRLLSEFVPFIGLFVLQGLLRKKMSQISVTKNSNT